MQYNITSLSLSPHLIVFNGLFEKWIIRRPVLKTKIPSTLRVENGGITEVYFYFFVIIIL